MIHQRRWLRIIALNLTASYLSTNVLFAYQPSNSIWQERKISLPASISPIQQISSALQFPKLNIPSSSLPVAWGTIKEANQNKTTDRHVLIIQDIHMNKEAQGNVARMVQHLIDKKAVDMVAMEGAFGQFDFKPFRHEAFRQVTKSLADAYLNENRIGGPSYAAITSNSAPPIYIGVDDEKHYQQNLDSYLASLKSQSDLRKIIERQKRAVSDLKRSQFNASLKQWDDSVVAYQAGTLGLAEFVKKINAMEAIHESEIARFLKAHELESSFDFKRVEAERVAVLEKLIAKLNSKEIDQLVAASVSYKAGEIGFAGFYRYLEKLLSKNSISLVSMPAFRNYLTYVLMADQINADALLEEIQQATDRVYAKLISSPEERQLVDQSNVLQLKGKLIEFSLTPNEWHEYQSALTLALSPRGEGTEFEQFEQFYKQADIRSEKMVSNLLSSNPHKNTVMVIGGFHTPEVTRLLKEKQIAYTVMSPKISKIEGTGSDYLSVFTREKTPLEKLFHGEKLFLYPTAHNIGFNNLPVAHLNREFKIHELLTLLLIAKNTMPGGVAVVVDKNNVTHCAMDARREDTPKGYFRIPGAIQQGLIPLQYLKPAEPIHVPVFRLVRKVMQAVRPLVVPLMVMGSAAAAMFFKAPELLAAAGMVVIGEFSRPKWSLAKNAPSMVGKRIVEMTMEMALPGPMIEALKENELSDDELRAAAMATSAGGIGPLLKERVIAQSTLGADVIGITLLYSHVWVQRRTVSPEGKPQVKLVKVEVGNHLKRVLSHVTDITVEMADGSSAKARVYSSKPGMFGQAPVYFLEHVHKYDESQITGVMYPGKPDASGTSEALRTAQSWFLGRGGLTLLEKFGIPRDFIILSEMPTMFGFPRLVQDRFSDHPLFKKMLVIFNDHTPLEYAHPKYDHGNLVRMNIDPRYYQNMSVWDPIRHVVDGTAMMIKAVDGVFGVAKKHADVMKRMPLLEQFSQKIKYVTNGVSRFYWPTDEFSSREKIDLLSDQQLLDVKKRRRHELIRFLAKRTKLGSAWAEKIINNNNPIGIWTRRIVQYKRLDVFTHMLENPNFRRQFLDTGIVFVVGGRIHQDNSWGTDQFNRILAMCEKYPELKERVIVFDDYNIWEAPTLFRGADFSVMLADDGQEASATGFQKAQMNGDLIIASHDGAVPESVVFYDKYNEESANGFEVPYVWQPDPNDFGHRWIQGPTSEGLLRGFQAFRNVFNTPELHGKLVRNALSQSERVDVNRTSQDMLEFLNSVYEKKLAEAAAYEEGRAKVKTLLPAIDQALTDFTWIRNHLLESHSFVWKYAQYGVSEKELKISGRGLLEFLQSHQYLLTLGTAAEWSLQFHAANNGGYGDVIAYLEWVLNGTPALQNVRDYIHHLGLKARKTTDTEERLSLNRKAIGAVEGLLEHLNMTKPVSNESQKSINASPSLLFGLLALNSSDATSIVPLVIMGLAFASMMVQRARRRAPLVKERKLPPFDYHDFLSDNEIHLARQTAERLKRVEEARSAGNPEQVAEALSQFVGLQSWELGLLNERLVSSPEFVIDQTFLHYQVAENLRSFQMKPLVDSLRNDSGEADQTKGLFQRNHIVLLAQGKTLQELEAEIAQAYKLAYASSSLLKVVLPDEIPDELRDRLRVRFIALPLVLASELADTASVANNLLDPSLRDGGKLKLLAYENNGLPESLARLLYELNKQPKYQNMVQVLFVNSLLAHSLATRATVMDVAAMFAFRRLVQSQA